MDAISVKRKDRMAIAAMATLDRRRQSLEPKSDVIACPWVCPARSVRSRSPTCSVAFAGCDPMNVLSSSLISSPGDGAFLSAIDALAERVGQIELVVFGENPHARASGEDKLATIARSLARMRQRRSRHFPPDLFAEPAWDMLLDLFINKARGVRVATTSLCLAANAPQATGLRYIAKLYEHGLLTRFEAPNDKRMVLVEITAKGYGQMRRCLGDLVP